MTNTQQHWENIYATKSEQEVSWTQVRPELSIYFIEKLGISKAAPIIDVGGGESHLVDYLLDNGYTDITVLDISSIAIEKAKARLGERAKEVQWLVSDVLLFQPTKVYALWHDRATFHFLLDKASQIKYVDQVARWAEGLVVATFSPEGPLKCSGLEIRQYDEDSMKQMFESAGFINVECQRENHITPFATTQNFVFCGFKREH